MSVADGSTSRVPNTRDLNAEFLKETLESDARGEQFEVVAKRFLRIDVDDFVWVKLGSVIAYHGDFKITREQLVQGHGGIIGREFAPLVKVEGKGRVYCADEGKRSQLFRISDGTLCVVGSALLAFEPTVSHEVHLVPGVGLLEGIFSVKLTGSGIVVVGTKGDPLTLRVTPDNPVVTDPDATLAWSGGVIPELKTELGWRMLIGQGSEEEIQMLFHGDGYVVVHAKEEDPGKRSLVGKVKSGLKKLIPG
jgi:uncharacterized protein (AIM24 family)